MSSRREDAPLLEVNVSLLADDVGVTPTNTLNLSQGVPMKNDELLKDSETE